MGLQRDSGASHDCYRGSQEKSGVLQGISENFRSVLGFYRVNGLHGRSRVDQGILEAVQ